MRSQRSALIVLLALGGLATTAGRAAAAITYVDDNLFHGAGVTGVAAVSTSVHQSGNYPVANAIDGMAGSSGEYDFVFASGNPDQRLVINGFNNSVGFIRLWTGSDIPPTEITVWSSTNNNASYNNTFETQLVATTALPNTTATWTSTGVGQPSYRDFYVNAPTGTKSLLFNFGSGNGLDVNQVGWARVGEIQATGRCINIDVNGQGAGDPTPTTYTGSAAAGGGLWNGYLVDSTGGGNVDPPKSGALQYADGSISTVKFDLSTSGGDAITDGMSSGNALMADYTVAPGPLNGPASMTFTLEGLKAGAHYSLYLYGKPGAHAGTGSTYTIGGATLTQTNTAGFDGTFVQDRDYVKFSDVVADSSGMITGTVNVGNIYSILNGVQLVEGVPEPGTLALLVTGLIGLLAYAWRKRR